MTCKNTLKKLLVLFLLFFTSNIYSQSKNVQAEIENYFNILFNGLPKSTNPEQTLNKLIYSEHIKKLDNDSYLILKNELLHYNENTFTLNIITHSESVLNFSLTVEGENAIEELVELKDKIPRMFDFSRESETAYDFVIHKPPQKYYNHAIFILESLSTHNGKLFCKIIYKIPKNNETFKFELEYYGF